jgi:RimJ/RimL family protein N-acetyltransferase
MSDFEIKPLTADHRQAAEAFAAKIPDGDRAFVDRSLLSQVSVAGWTRRSTARRTGAFLDDQMVAIMTVNQQAGWMHRVGELRLVVLPEARGKGLATELAHLAVDVAREMGLSKLYVEVLAQLEQVVDMFVALGFEQEAVLRDHVVDGDGQPGNLCVLSRFLDEQSS